MAGGAANQTGWAVGKCIEARCGDLEETVYIRRGVAGDALAGFNPPIVRPCGDRINKQGCLCGARLKTEEHGKKTPNTSQEQTFSGHIHLLNSDARQPASYDKLTCGRVAKSEQDECH